METKSHPPSPLWDTTRPYLTGAAQLEPHTTPTLPLSSYPPSTQQALVLEDTLHALLGMRTSYTHISIDTTLSYSANKSALQHAHPEIIPLLSRILPLASHHAIVSSFVERTRVPRSGSGYVRQAIGVALSELLSEYRSLIIRLEDSLRKDQLSLQKLLYVVQPSARSMSLLRDVVVAVGDRNGGAALDALFKLAVAHVGTPEIRQVLAFIVGKAAAPLFAIMDVWIRRGVVDDPYDEFFVRENERFARGNAPITIATSSTAWEMRYTVNRENVPDFLAPFVEKVLRGGKYLNVLRECGLDAAGVVVKKEGQEMGYLDLSGKVLLGAEAGRKIGEFVERSFVVSSKALMEYLEEEICMMERLKSLRRFFLLEQSDFVLNFFDAAAEELGKSRRDMSRSRLASLLELSIRTSVSRHDKFVDDLGCVLCTEDFATQIVGMGKEEVKRGGVGISGYESFALDYKLKWPMSLIVSNLEVLKYQLIFRYLFYCKYVERELEECWQHHSQSKKALHKVAGSFVRSFALRNRMLQFVRNILYYTTADVLEPNWRVLYANAKRAQTIDELMHFHARFLDVSVEQSLLSNERHLGVFKKIAETCVSFAAYTERFSDLFKERDQERVEEQLRKRNYPTTLAKFETAFNMHLGKLLDGLSAVSKKRANVHLANLCDRLDVDGFYARATERALASYGV